MKIIINMIMGCIMSGFAEGMAVADRAGLSQEMLLDVLNLGAISSPLISGKGKGEGKNIITIKGCPCSVLCKRLIILAEVCE